jgi:lambda repressor-like predicted transcriptional regulator
MDTSTERSDWRTALRAQGRTLRWLASQTGKSPRTLYAYSRGDLVPPAEWMAAASRVLGEDLTHIQGVSQ